ncbi:MAG: YihY/virulence factor BrkB family protein [Gammaproteobacteria bacterium]|nr:YihY/virulence factor BrkB family protein [Gammaproteobacteria bacterium]
MFARLFEALPAPVQIWMRILIAAGRNWSDSRAATQAAGLSFYTLFSLAPIMIMVVTMVGLVLGERAAQGELMAQLQTVLGSEAAEVINTAVANSRIDRSGIWPTLLGACAIIIGATTVFAQMQQSLNRIWQVVPRPSRSSLWLLIKARVLSLTIVLAIGFVLLVSLLLSVALQVIVAYSSQWLPVPAELVTLLEICVSLMIITLLFAAIFRILPDVILSWRDVLPGAFITALLFSAGRYLIALYLANSATASTYGAAGSLVLLLLWVYYSSLILFYGAAITRAHVEARGLPIRPRNTAVIVQHHLLEE